MEHIKHNKTWDLLQVTIKNSQENWRCQEWTCFPRMGDFIPNIYPQYIYRHAHICIHVYIIVHIHIHIHVHIHIHIHIQIQSCTYTYTIIQLYNYTIIQLYIQ